jgi:predicted ribosomally synthesized peptide with SipW-like signal peptide
MHLKGYVKLKEICGAGVVVLGLGSGTTTWFADNKDSELVANLAISLVLL